MVAELAETAGGRHPRFACNAPPAAAVHGRQAQQTLKQSVVFIAGAGGLGSPVAVYLAAAGVGHLRVCDCDTVELSNLNRQILHDRSRVGARKVDSAHRRLAQLNDNVRVVPIETRIDAGNVDELLGPAHAIVDCTDNFEARYALTATLLDNHREILAQRKWRHGRNWRYRRKWWYRGNWRKIGNLRLLREGRGLSKPRSLFRGIRRYLGVDGRNGCRTYLYPIVSSYGKLHGAKLRELHRGMLVGCRSMHYHRLLDLPRRPLSHGSELH